MNHEMQNKLEKISEKFRLEREREYHSMYEKYVDLVEIQSGGLIQATKSDFLKMMAFQQIIEEERQKQFNKK